VEQVETYLKQESAQDKRMPLLVQLPGVAMLTAITILAAIGDMNPLFKSFHNHAGLSQSLV